MGKSQYKSKTRRRHNPISVPDGHGSKIQDGKVEDVLPIIKKVRFEFQIDCEMMDTH